MSEGKKYHLLVSGCGGDIGQSIGKILRHYDLIDQLHGIDISDKNPAKFIYPRFSVGLPVRDVNFLPNLKKYISDHAIDLFLPMAEPELRFFSTQGVTDKIGGAAMISANPEALEIGFDKLKTAEFLRQSGLPFPRTFGAADKPQIDNFPLIFKPRSGSGSKSLLKINDKNQLEQLGHFFDLQDYLLQEYLPDHEEEYTCGLFRGKSGEIRTIIFRRQLTAGFSGYGELIEHEQIDGLLVEIAEKIRLCGSINVQLRLNKGVPFVFEINPRFSSTVLFRHMFGFKDVEWSIQDALGMPLAPYVRDETKRFFYKSYHEIID